MADFPENQLVLSPAEKRRRTPRIHAVEFAEDGSELVLVFAERMDNTQNLAVVRLFNQNEGVREFTNFTWASEFRLISTTSSFVIGYVGATYATYMEGNIRSKRRFELMIRNRCDRATSYEASVLDGGTADAPQPLDLDGGDALGVFAESVDGGIA